MFGLFLAIPALVLVLLGAAVGAGVRAVKKRSNGGEPQMRRRVRWGRAALTFLALWFLVVPGVLGAFAPHIVRTRDFERGYLGPRIDSAGRWLPPALDDDEDSAGLFADQSGRVEQHTLRSEDGTGLRIHAVAAVGEARAVVVLSHGLFRSGFEIDPVAQMFSELGCAVVLLNLRNHGGSERAGCSFGDRETDDVLAAVEFAQGWQPYRPLVLFGVSLGSVATARAAARLPDLRGLVLDAPFDDFGQSARRYLGRQVTDPMLTVMLTTMQWSGGFSFDALSTVEVVPSLNPDLPALIVGGGDDVIAVPEGVRAVYEALPSRANSVLWIEPDSGHGKVWTDDRQRYREELEALLVKATGG
ncbi:MAG: alpha/beta hydrolase [Planctomycetota bacterium]